LPLLIDIVNPIYTKYDPGHVYEDAIADAGAGRCHVHASLLMRGWGFFGGRWWTSPAAASATCEGPSPRRALSQGDGA
jgi:hypothetical protein